MRNRVDGKAELGDRAGFEVLHEHVGLGQHRFQHRFIVVLVQIEHERLLAAISQTK